MRCFEVNPDVTTELKFWANTNDGDVKYFVFHLVDLLVDGSVFGETNTCYLGIFKNTNAQHPTMTYAGVAFLKKYYTFFDMTGYDTAEFLLGQKLRVGIGARNPDNFILDKQYDHYFDGYAPNLNDQSVFTFQPNQYTYREDDPNDPNSPNYHGKNSTVVTIVIVFGCLILAILIGLFVLKYREQKKKQAGYLTLSKFGDAMRPSEMGDSTTNLNYSLNEDDTPTTADKKPLMSINQSTASMQVSQDI